MKRTVTYFAMVVIYCLSLTAQNPIELPFIENFDDATSLTTSWTVLDANSDGMTWQYNSWNVDADGGLGSMQVMIPGGKDYGADEYLITNPLILSEAGTYHLTFYVILLGTESLEVLYGTSSDPEEMSLLVDYPAISDNGWNINIIHFEIDAPGNYHFAFHYYSHASKKGFGLDFDKVTIESGRYVGVPDIMLNKPIIPVSACDIGAEEAIGVEVYNAGTEPITEFTLTYQVNNNAPISQVFNEETIGIRESVTVYFDQKADLSAIGDYSIVYHASTPNEEKTDNNETKATVSHLTPIAELPFESDFTVEEDIADWNPELPGGWAINGYSGSYYAVDLIPLLSRCVTLEPDVYRFSYNFSAGLSIYGSLYDDDFYIAYGKSGTDPSTWSRAKEYYNFYTEEKKIDDEITITITEEGEYVFAVFPLRIGVLSFFTTSLSKVSEHDFRINEIISPPSMPRIIPKYHAEGEKTFQAIIENRGKTASESGTIKLMHDGDVLAAENFSFSTMEEIKTIDMVADFKSYPIGELALKFDALLESGMGLSTEVIKIVSDSIFAWDNIDGDFLDGVGYNGIPGAIGMIYEVKKADVLTSITLGLTENESTSNLGLAVYKVDDNLELGEMLFEVEHPRTNGNNAEGIPFDVPDTRLEPGKYFFELRQLDGNNISIAFDNDPAGFLYDNTDTPGTLGLLIGFGYIHLRPNFGKSPVGIPQLKILDNQLLTYPNPAKEALNIRLDGQTIVKVMVYNTAGKMVSTASGINSSTYKLNTEALSSGIYFISVQTETGVVSSKFIVQ